MVLDNYNIKIALALSGGGVRATVFHLGLLLRLAHDNLLGNVVKISTVSGGSLAIGLIFSHSNLSWPTSEEFRKSILPRIATLLTTQSLQQSTVKELLYFPWNICFGYKLVNALEKAWGIQGTLKDIPRNPEWFINTTSINTGKNWRFSQSYMGDWVFGHNFDQQIEISLAVAASAAIPYLVGKVEIPISTNGWHKIDPATDKPIQTITPPSKSVYLWDGGVYENLGIEPLYKPQRGTIGDYDLLIICDASAFLAPNYENPTGIFHKKFPYVRTPRLFDITTDQIRSLRSRYIFHDVQKLGLKASIIRLGNTVKKIDGDVHKKHPDRSERSDDYENYLPDLIVSEIATMGTHAQKITMSQFNNLLRHGFETADATLTGYQNNFFPNSIQFDYSDR